MHDYAYNTIYQLNFALTGVTLKMTRMK